MRAMAGDYIRGVKFRDGKPTAHEVRIQVPTHLRDIIGKANLIKYLPTPDRRQANVLGEPWVFRFRQIVRQAESEFDGQGDLALGPIYMNPPWPWQPFTGGLQSQPYPKPARQREPITTATVIDLWMAERAEDDDPPKERAVRAYRDKLAIMFAHLGKPDDFRAISKEDLQSYRRDLITGKVATTDKRHRKPHTRDHLQTIKSLFSVASRGGYIPVNPGIDIPLPTKNDKTRQPFTPDERMTVLAAAMLAEPAIKWAHLLAAYTAAIQSELRYLTPANVYQVDGRWVVHIRPPEGGKLKSIYRPRILPLHSALIKHGFLDYVEQVRRGGDDAPLFPLTTAQFERRTNRLIQGCGIEKTFYCHRHFVASELEGFKILDEKGRQIDVSRYVAGHAALDIHERHYVHRSLDQLATAIETLSAL